MSSPCSQAASLLGQGIQTKNKSTFLFLTTKINVPTVHPKLVSCGHFYIKEYI